MRLSQDRSLRSPPPRTSRETASPDSVLFILVRGKEFLCKFNGLNVGLNVVRRRKHAGLPNAGCYC